MAAERVLSIPQEEARNPEGGRGAPVPSAAELPLASLLVLAGLAAALVAQGGYYGAGQRLVAVLLAAAAIVGFRSRTASNVVTHPVTRACAALATWSVASAALAGDWTGAASTALVLTGAVVVVLTCMHLDVQHREQLALALVGLGVVVALSGWAGVAWHRAPWALKDQGLWRAATTLTYANAAAGFLAVTALLSLARSTAAAVSPLNAGTTFVLLTGLGATLSRGGFLAFVVGALVLTRLLGLSPVVRGGVAPVLGALVALAGLWPSIPASSAPRPFVAVVALAGGLLVATAASRLRPRPLLAVFAVSALVVTVIATVPAGDTTRKITSARFAVASPDRVDEVRAALRLAADRPVSGMGPGQADLSWTRADGAFLVARYAHNEYLQVLAELGVVGLGLLLTLLAVIVRTVGRFGLKDRMRPVWAGVAASLVALAVHGLFDFGWHLPAIALTGAVLVGIVTTSEREEQS